MNGKVKTGEVRLMIGIHKSVPGWLENTWRYASLYINAYNGFVAIVQFIIVGKEKQLF